MEEHLLYKQEICGSIPSCSDIHMEWRWSIFGDGGSFDDHQWALVTFFDPHRQDEMVTVNELHHIYASIVTTLKVP